MKFLHVAYLITMVGGFLTMSKCTEEQPYPWCFVIGDVVYFVALGLCMQFTGKDADKFKPETGAKEEKQHALTMAQFKAFFSKAR